MVTIQTMWYASIAVPTNGPSGVVPKGWSRTPIYEYRYYITFLFEKSGYFDKLKKVLVY